MNLFTLILLGLIAAALIWILIQRYQFRSLKSYGYDEPLKHIPEESYSFKALKITTEDGYILSLFRIRHRENFDSDLPPVVMMHGLSSSAINYIMGGESKSPALILASKG